MEQKMELFLGPCIIENEKMALEIANRLKEDFKDIEDDVSVYFKASFDKANRTSISSYRGPGLEMGMKILAKVKEQTNLPLLVDFHLPEQAEALGQVVDVLQIPAFLCRQTDMIVAAAKVCGNRNKKLNIKKGQFLSPEETKNIVEKAKSFMDQDGIYLTERGTTFGYNNLIVDMASFQTMKSFGARTIYDATHAIQRPGGHGTSTAGKREQLLVLAKAAVAAGADGVFLEVHPNPPLAKSDRATCLALSKVRSFIDILLPIWKLNKTLLPGIIDE